MGGEIEGEEGQLLIDSSTHPPLPPQHLIPPASCSSIHPPTHPPTHTQGCYKNALVVGADALSRWVDWEDRNSCILFGDGAGAVVLTAAEGDNDAGVLGFAMHSDGTGKSSLLPRTHPPTYLVNE